MPEEFQPYFYKKPQDLSIISPLLLFGLSFMCLGILLFLGSFFDGKINSSSFLYFVVGFFCTLSGFFKKNRI